MPDADEGASFYTILKMISILLAILVGLYLAWLVVKGLLK